MYSHIMRIRRPAVVPPEPAAPPLPRGATPRPGCKADSGRPADLVFPARAAGPWEHQGHSAPCAGRGSGILHATKECGPSSRARRPVQTAADGAMADLRTATSPAGNGAIILEALQIQ